MSQPEAHIYNLATGVIRTTIIGDAKTIAINVWPGESIFIGKVNPQKQIIQGGVPVDAPEKTKEEKPVDKFSYARLLDALAGDKLDEFVKKLKKARE